MLLKGEETYKNKRQFYKRTIGDRASDLWQRYKTLPSSRPLRMKLDLQMSRMSDRGKGKSQLLELSRANWELPKDHPAGVDLGQYTAARP